MSMLMYYGCLACAQSKELYLQTRLLHILLLFFVLQVSGSQITLLERGEFSRRTDAQYVPPHISFSMRKHQVGKTFMAKLILV